MDLMNSGTVVTVTQLLNVAGALALAAEVPDGEQACIVTILCDRGDRYFVPLKWEKHYEW